MHFLGLALLIAGWIDDSGTMVLEEDGQRKDTLITLVGKISEICSAHEPDAHTVHFLNSGEPEREKGEKWEEYLGRHEFGGVTRIGTELKRQILDDLVFNNPDQVKPLRVLIFTDGAVYLSP